MAMNENTRRMRTRSQQLLAIRDAVRAGDHDTARALLATLPMGRAKAGLVIVDVSHVKIEDES